MEAIKIGKRNKSRNKRKNKDKTNNSHRPGKVENID